MCHGTACGTCNSCGPVAFAVSGLPLTLVDLVCLQPHMFHHPDGLILVVDKGYRDRATEAWLRHLAQLAHQPTLMRSLVAYDP